LKIPSKNSILKCGWWFGIVRTCDEVPWIKSKIVLLKLYTTFHFMQTFHSVLWGWDGMMIFLCMVYCIL